MLKPLGRLLLNLANELGLFPKSGCGPGLYTSPPKEMALCPPSGHVGDPKVGLCQTVGWMPRQDFSLHRDPKAPLQSSGGGCQDHKQ